MSNDTLASKIELVKEQIANFEKSGFFTDKEIESKTIPLRAELATLQMHQEISNSSKSFIGATRGFNDFFEELKKLDQSLFEIEVIDAEILTPNHIKA